MTTEELNDLYAEIMKSRMGVNPYVSIGANVGGNLISAIVANQARRRAQERLSGLQRPSMPQFRQNPLLAQRIAQQQQLADQPMMGYQRAADEQAGRQMERGRQIAAGLGGGAGLAYMQGVSSNIAAQQRQGLLADMAMQARNRGELDQLINMRNQELQQQRSLDAMNYQLGFQDYIRQREGLQADIAQQQANIGAAIGASVADIPQYVQNFQMYNALKNLPKPTGTTGTPVFEVPSLTAKPKTFIDRMLERVGPKPSGYPALNSSLLGGIGFLPSIRTGDSRAILEPSPHIGPGIPVYSMPTGVSLFPGSAASTEPAEDSTSQVFYDEPPVRNTDIGPVSPMISRYLYKPPLPQYASNVWSSNLADILPARKNLYNGGHLKGLRGMIQKFMAQRRLNRDYRWATYQLGNQIEWHPNPLENFRPRPFLRDPRSGSLTLLRKRNKSTR